MSDNINPHAEVLRAAGHPEAADLLERLSALEPKTAASEPEAETRAEIAGGSSVEEQGRALLDQLNASRTPWHSAGEL